MSVRCIIEYDHTAIGYIQYYPLDAEGYKNIGFLKNEDEAIFATDQFIGESDYWNKGIGKQLVMSMVNFLETTGQLNADRIVVEPTSRMEYQSHHSVMKDADSKRSNC